MKDTIEQAEPQAAPDLRMELIKRHLTPAETATTLRDLRGLELARPARMLSLWVMFTGGIEKQRIVVVTDTLVPLEAILKLIASGQTAITRWDVTSGNLIVQVPAQGYESLGFWYTGHTSGGDFSEPEQAVLIEVTLCGSSREILRIKL